MRCEVTTAPALASPEANWGSAETSPVFLSLLFNGSNYKFLSFYKWEKNRLLPN